MEKSIPLYTYISVLIVYSLALVLALFKQKKTEKAAGLTGLIVCGTGIAAMIFLEKRPPLFGSFEAALYLSFILGILTFLPGKALLTEASKKRLTCLSYGGILFILLLQLGGPMAFNNDFYMYDDLKVIVFFNFRLVAAAFFSYAALLFNFGAWSKITDKGEKDFLMQNGRNFLLTGIAVYLISEWAGSLWCLNWFGDSWIWNKGFFKASIVFLLVMASCHLPPSFSKSHRTKAILGSSPAVFILWMIFHH